MNTYKKNFIIFIFLIVIITVASGCSGKIPGRVSNHLKYSGYSESEFSGFAKESLFVTMKDGTDLAVDIFLPRGGPKVNRFPAIFVFTPYGRSYIHTKLKWYEKLIARFTKGTPGPVFDWSTRDDVKLFLSHGYAFVIADMRGTGASFGSQIPFTPPIAEDGKELIDWISSQAWSNGKVGMMGQSYLGWIQLMVAAKKPKALACIMPEVILCDAYTEGIHPGGIDAIAWINRYSGLLQGVNLNNFDPGNLRLPTSPVVDEDGDGDLSDEIPLMGKDGSFIDKGEPVYPDGKKRKGIYYRATMEHKRNILFTSFARKYAPYIDSREQKMFGNFRYMEGSPGWYLNEIIKSGIPVYNIGGWFDGFAKGAPKLFATMQGKTKARLHIAPRFHYPPYISKSYMKYFNYDADYKKQITIERLRFFDFYLKGIRNGFDNEPPVNIYVMNSGWRSENEWPLKRQKFTPFYMNTGGVLATAGSAEGVDKYHVDFTHSSSYGRNNVNRWLMMYVPDGLMERTGPDKKCLYYETSELKENLEVTGHPVINLWVSSNRDDGDFFVYLADVDESGKSLYVTEGQLRAGWKNVYNDDTQTEGKVDIKPDLPWHGYKKDQYTAKPLSGGKAIELSFDLMPTSWLFKKGHKIRIAIACADCNNFEMNPGLCSGNNPHNCPETILHVYSGPKYPSRIILPLIPGK